MNQSLTAMYLAKDSEIKGSEVAELLGKIQSFSRKRAQYLGDNIRKCVGRIGGRQVAQRRQLARTGDMGPVNIQALVNAAGEQAVRVNVDYSKVPAPDAYYVSDYARISASGSTVEIVFGKREGSIGKLRNKLEVNIPAYAFLGQWMASLPFLKTVKDSLESKGLPAYETPDNIDEFTEKVQTVVANNTFISGGESECTVDLYFLPPRDLRFFIEKHEAASLEPLVRVITEGRILAGMSNRFQEIAEQIRKFAPDLKEFEIQGAR